MASRTSFFNQGFLIIEESIRRYAPLWVLYSLTRDASEVQRLEERILTESGGKSYAVKEILL